MKIKNLLIGLLGSVAAAIAIVQADQNLNETILLNDEVDVKSITNTLTELTNDGYLLGKLKKVRLIINSPGGSANQLELLTRLAPLLGRNITTEIPAFAASAAADIFLLGKERLMHKKSTILFHEERIMVGGGFFSAGYVVTLTDLESFVNTGKLADNSPVKHAEAEVIKILKGMPSIALKRVLKLMQDSSDENIEYIMEKLGVTEEFVRKNLVVPNVDVELGLKEALALGVATGELK